MKVTCHFTANWCCETFPECCETFPDRCETFPVCCESFSICNQTFSVYDNGQDKAIGWVRDPNLGYFLTRIGVTSC